MFLIKIDHCFYSSVSVWLVNSVLMWRRDKALILRRDHRHRFLMYKCNRQDVVVGAYKIHVVTHQLSRNSDLVI